MAKSLRSKRKRKIRAEKRIVNAKKELVKLREVAAKLHSQPLTKEALEANLPHVQVREEPMQVDTKAAKGAAKIDTRWMNQRKIKQIKSRIKRHNTKKARRSSSAGLSSRRSKKH